MSTNRPLPRSAFAEKLLEFPGLALADDAVFQNRGKWAQLFAERIGSGFGGRLILDLGCFDARFLAEIAASLPETGFVGIDWKCKAIHDGAKHISELALRNVVLLRARAGDLAKIFANGEIDEIWVFHPDPCDRQSERRNRLMSKGFLLQAHAALRDGNSILALKTDHAEYFRSVADLFNPNETDDANAPPPSVRQSFHIARSSEDYWNDPAAIAHTAGRPFAGRQTLFESRFIRRRQRIFYAELQKNQLFR